MREDNDDFEFHFYGFFLFWTNNSPNTSPLSTDLKVLYKGNKRLCPFYSQGNGITKERVIRLSSSRGGNTDSTCWPGELPHRHAAYGGHISIAKQTFA